MRKKCKVIEQKYDRKTDKLLETKTLGRELTPNRVNQLVRSFVNGFRALDSGYENYKTFNDGNYWLFYFYSPTFMKDYYFILTVQEEKNPLEGTIDTL